MKNLAPRLVNREIVPVALRLIVHPKLPPIGRFIRADEVTAAVAFLLSAEAGAITGQQLVICGGRSL
jgi:NAD(P)-dependent dehydrogenase (short-subunit alcohol dehydrogenase family)